MQRGSESRSILFHFSNGHWIGTQREETRGSFYIKTMAAGLSCRGTGDAASGCIVFEELEPGTLQQASAVALSSRLLSSSGTIENT